uniref:Uncharacterized protein n=1 Tax=Sphaerodactylus townsendi TaxID=933632 RepID=A0ACB8FRF5_9SAUR
MSDLEQQQAVPEQIDSAGPNQEASPTDQPLEGLFEFPTSYQEMFKFFCTHSTIHGALRLICPAENKMKTTFWIVLFLLTIALLYWQFGETLQHYYSYPINLKISLRSDKLTFPAITLCTLKPQRYAALQEELEELDRLTHQTLKDLYGFDKPREQNPPQSRLPHILRLAGHIQHHPLRHLTPDDPTSLQGSDQDGRVGFLLCNETNEDCFYQTFSSGIDAVQEWYRFHYVNLLARLPSNQMLDEDSDANFIISCRFNKEPCNKRNFTHFRHPTYGNCYTLNDKSNNTRWTSSMPGIQHGLSLLLSTERKDMIQLLPTGSGARVMVHDQNEPAFMEEGGFDVRPGIQTSITVKKACVNSCFQSIMVQRCGCAYFFYPLPSGAEYCDYAKHVAWGHCYYRLQAEFKSNKLDCFNKCPRACRCCIEAGRDTNALLPFQEWISHVLAQKTEYKTTQRSSAFRSSSSYALKLAFALLLFLIRNSISKVHIFFDEWRYKSTQETPAFTVNMLVSQLGALWGLWFGSSVLSLMEVLELILDGIAVTCIMAFNFFGLTSAPKTADDAVSSSCVAGDTVAGDTVAGDTGDTVAGDTAIQPIPCDRGKAECPTKTSSLKTTNDDALLEPKNNDEATFHLKPCGHNGITTVTRSSDSSSWSCDSYPPQPGSNCDDASQYGNTPVFHSGLPIPCIIKDFVDMEPTGRDRDFELGL